MLEGSQLSYEIDDQAIYVFMRRVKDFCHFVSVPAPSHWKSVKQEGMKWVWKKRLRSISKAG